MGEENLAIVYKSLDECLILVASMMYPISGRAVMLSLVTNIHGVSKCNMVTMGSMPASRTVLIRS